MSDDNLPLDFNARYALFADGAEVASGGARLDLTNDSLGLKPDQGQVLNYPLREITDLLPGDYCVTLVAGEEKLTLSHLGKDYENFQRELSRRRSALLLSDLLMEEPLIIGNLRADVVHISPEHSKTSGKAELRLYQTALVVIPEVGTPVRVPFSDINEAKEQDYRYIIRTEYGDEFTFSRLGRDLEPLKRNLGELSQNLALKVQAMVKELMPSASQAMVLKLAGIMKEGRAARRRDIEAVGPGLWHELEQQILNSDASEEYAYLKSIGNEQDLSIGVKRGLKEGEADYLWFMVPVYSTGHHKPGNAVIMEAISGEGESRATYAFRLVGRKTYPSLKTEEALQLEAARFLRDINRALIAINFRREPIYLTREMLRRPQYARYMHSIAALPELRALRWLYIGRVLHITPEQWQSDLADLLAFNTKTTDDAAIWIKSSG